MRREESSHRASLIEKYRQRFGEHIAPVLRAGHRADERCIDPGAPWRSRSDRTPPLGARRIPQTAVPAALDARSRGPGQTAAVCPPDRAAGPGRPDGRLGVDAGAAVCRRLRNA
jgi:hypothetical protein